MNEATLHLPQPDAADVFRQFVTPVRFPRTPRDAQMIRALYDYRVLTARQFEQLFWYPDTIGVLAKDTDVNTRCLLRLRLMTNAECSYRASLHTQTQGNLPFVYFLWKNGERYLVEHDGIEKIDWNKWRKDISEFSLWHSTQVNDVRIATELSARRNGFTLETWVDEPTIKRTHVRMVCPDGYYVLVARGPRLFRFTEIDRATETGLYKNPNGRDWADKIDKYQAFFRQGQFQKMYEAPNGSCCVFTVTTSERRLANLKKITEDKGGKNRYWFTTMDKALTEDITTAPIWQIAGRDGLFSQT